MAVAVEALVGTETRSLHLPDRGLIVELPPSCAQGIFIDPKSDRAEIDPMTKAQLNVVINDPILRNRYPSPEEGEKYMDKVSPQRRDELLEKARLITEGIKVACWSRGEEYFAVILYGSLARNLARHRVDEDPSNVDVVVIGNFTFQKGREILSSIRPLRQKLATEIKTSRQCMCETIQCGCSDRLARRYFDDVTASYRNEYGRLTENPSVLVEGLDVVVQSEDTIRSSGYGLARDYMAACARPLYDKFNLWEKIENEAIVYLQLPPKVRRKIREGKSIDYWLDPFIASWEHQSSRFRQDRGVIERTIESHRRNP